jgi:hypothetical protein
VGANARKLSTWQSLINTISKNLGTWNNMWVSMEVGRSSLIRFLNLYLFSSSLIWRCQ